MRNTLTILYTILSLAVYAQSDTLAFPQNWQGQYAGTLEIFNATGIAQSLPMELHILPIDSSDNYTWTIIYGEDKVAGARNYELIEVDKTKGLYKIDEKNSIILEGYLFGDTFIQTFEVQGSLLTTKTQKINDNQITWEIIFGGFEPVNTTGNQVIKGDTIPPVKAFPIKGIQKALLTRT